MAAGAECTAGHLHATTGCRTHSLPDPMLKLAAKEATIGMHTLFKAGVTVTRGCLAECCQGTAGRVPGSLATGLQY